ncbi:thioredoxin-related transmembrane protein 2-B-like [Gigantopelta aegis]|uniref:thioredoxin-related transmembrane protein 2-B-like n=1 Tax=Gigantopelta aegis TaxID=1735272 RepID=UPI001B88D4E0|nr:thioredoxin-related transmembrane protein 2-B-like [Gigantopelta aegis]
MDLNAIRSGLASILIPYYIFSIFLSVLFFIVKKLPFVCEILFEDCELDLKEWEYLTFLGCVIVLKNRKQTTFASYVSTTCMFAKVLNGFLFFKHNFTLGLVYPLLCLLQFIFVPEPCYEGPEYITYFRGPNLDEELQRDKRIRWFITFYAAWSPPCVTFASVFSEISAGYHRDNLKFGKIDVTKYPAVAEKYNINCSSWSKQLPTVILFEDGKEKVRRPAVTKRTTLKYAFVKENVIRDFELNEVYNQCKKNPLPVRKKEKKEQ